MEIDLTNNKINGKHSFFLEYYNKCMSGEYVVGREIKQVLSNLYDDLVNDRYIYDMREAHKRIEFAELFCIQTKNKFHGKPIKYMLWQKARKEVTYGFLRKDTGKRRFKEVIELVARKNGKSTDKASEGMIDLFTGSGGLDICCSSNDDAQADLIFQELKNMRDSIDPNEKYTKSVINLIHNKKNKSKIFKISDKTRNKEGRNIYIAYIDEIHEMKDNTIFMSIQQSTSIADDPIIYEITTEGMVDDGYLDKRLIYARKVLNGELEDEALLVWLYTQDSEDEIWDDENTWWKSNPSMGTIKSWDYLRRNVEKARVSREDRAFILCKDFNLKQNKAISWLLEEEAANDAVFSWELVRGWFYIGGIDLSDTTDLTAVNMEFMSSDGETLSKQMYFIPESKANGDITLNGERKDYRTWATEGYVTILPGNEVNSSAVIQWLWDMYELYQVKPFKIGYDNWGAKGMIEDIQRRWGDDITIRVKMDYNLSNPMRSLGADLKDKKINYDNNPVTRWCLKNVATKTNNIGQIMPVKTQGVSHNRIDGALSMIISRYVRSMYIADFTLFSRNNIISHIEGGDQE